MGRSPLGLEPLHLRVTLAPRMRWSQGYLIARPELRRSAGSNAGRQQVHERHPKAAQIMTGGFAGAVGTTGWLALLLTLHRVLHTIAPSLGSGVALVDQVVGVIAAAQPGLAGARHAA